MNAPDCGNTGGNWSDSKGYTYALSDADSNGKPEPVVGFLNYGDIFCASVWEVVGTRTGTQIGFTATNPSGASSFCPALYTVTGTYSLVGIKPTTSNNGCNTATGTWRDSAGKSGNWSWTREGTVLLRRANAGPSPTDK